MARVELTLVGEDRASAVFRKVGSALSGLGKIAVGGAVAGISALGAGLISAVGEARGAAAVMGQLDAALASTGGRAGRTREQIAELASSLSDAAGASRFSDDAIASAGTRLLQFNNIAGDTFDRALRLSTDLAQRLGKDVPSAAQMLGKALNDPAQALTSLARLGIEFTAAQEEQVRAMLAVGDTAAAQAFIMTELEKGVKGAAQAAANAAGPFARIQAQFGEMLETIGGGALEHFGRLGEAFGAGGLLGRIQPFFDWIAEKAVWAIGSAIDAVISFKQAASGEWIRTDEIRNIHQIAGTLGLLAGEFGRFFDMLRDGWPVATAAGVAIAKMADALGASDATVQSIYENTKRVVEGAASAFQTLGDAIGWARTNADQIIGSISVLTIAVQTMQIVTMAAGWIGTLSTAIATLGVTFTAAGGGIAGVVAILGGPLIVTVGLIAGAIALLGLAWTTNFMGIQERTAAAWATIQPILARLGVFLQETLARAVAAVAHDWNTVLYPALQLVGNFLQTSVIPVFQALVDHEMTRLNAAVTALSNLWRNTLYPGLVSVQTFINDRLIPGLSRFEATIATRLTPALTTAEGLLSAIKRALDAIGSVIDWVVGKLGALSNAFNSIQIPDELIPGSPTPFELGLRGINAALQQVNTTLGTTSALFNTMPAVTSALAGAGGPISGLTVGDVRGALLAGDYLGAGRGIRYEGPGSEAAPAINIYIERVGDDVDVEAMAYRIQEVLANR